MFQIKGSAFTVTTDVEYKALRDRAKALREQNEAIKDDVEKLQAEYEALEGQDDEGNQNTMDQLTKAIEEKQMSLKEASSCTNIASDKRGVILTTKTQLL